MVLDGLIDLSYGPRDLVLLDGNYLHTMGRLRALPTRDGVKVLPLERRSFIIFNRWQRQKMGKGRHDPCWDEKWRASVPWTRYNTSE